MAFVAKQFALGLVGLLLASSANLQAAQTVLAMELFEGIGTLDGSSPGALGTWVSGSWAKRPIGPRTDSIAEPGWSGDAQGTGVQSYWNLASVGGGAARNSGMVGCWVRFTDFSHAGYFSSPTIANPAVILRLSSGEDNSPVQIVGVTTGGQLITRNGSGWLGNGLSFAPHTWYWVQIEWETTTNPDFFSTRVSYQALGGPFTSLATTNLAISSYFASRAHVGNFGFQVQPFQNYAWRGRLGGAVFASIGAIGEGGVPADLLPPVEEPHTWHLNPSTGSDTHDGLTPATAWRSLAKLNAEGAHAGFRSAASYLAGDTLRIDTSVAPLELGASVFTLQTPGLTVRPAAGQSQILLRAEKDVSATQTLWTRFDPVNYPNVWQTTDNGATDLESVVIWEDDKWLNHPTGAMISDVQASLNAIPGSFFSDGTTLYLHPFGSSNPTTDGKTYTRSRFRNDSRSPAPGPGQSAIFFFVQEAASMQLIGARVRKTALARSTDSNPILAYGIQIGHSGTAGEVALRDCYLDYNSKHAFGTTVDGNNLLVTLENCRGEQCQPTGTVFVDFNGTAGRSGNRTIYKNCSSLTPLPVIGSTGGQTGGTAYLSHNSAGSSQFTSVDFVGGIYHGSFSVGDSVDHLTLSGTTLGGNPGGSGQGCLNVTATTCTMTALPLSAGGPGSTTTVRNCLLLFSQGQFVNTASALAQGAVFYEANTFDLRPCVSSDVSDFALFRRVGALDLTFRNNIFIVPSGKQFTLLDAATSADSLTFANNLYRLGSAGFVVKNFNDGSSIANRTLGQWQALGKDGGSQNADPQLDATYFPAPASPANDAGANLGPLADFSGRLFSSRRTIGALEPEVTFAHWRETHFNSQELADETISGPGADPDGDRVSNQIEYALRLNPNLPDAEQAITTQLEPLGGERYLTLRYTRPRYIADLSFLPESSGNLFQWQSGTGATVLVSLVENADDTESVVVRDTQPARTNVARFLRLAIVPSAP